MTFFHQLIKATSLYILSVVIIIIYCALLYIIGHVFMPEKAGGSLIFDDQGQIRGSKLIAQIFTQEKYFYGRISNRVNNKCDMALYNKLFKEELNNSYKLADNKDDISMITPSSSLLDPYIMRSEALRQAARVANAREMDIDTIVNLINRLTLWAAPPFFELDIVNVTLLNAHLDNFL